MHFEVYLYQGEDQKGEDGDEPGANDNEENDAEKSEEQQRQELVERIAETEQVSPINQNLLILIVIL